MNDIRINEIAGLSIIELPVNLLINLSSFSVTLLELNNNSVLKIY